MSGLKFDTIIPSTFVPKPLVSGSQHVIRRRQTEILPVSQVTYQQSANDRILFNINSASEFMDAQNSYLRFELRTYGLSSSGTADPLRSLATGGANALFKQIIIRLQNGTEIIRIDDYNRWFAQASTLTQSAEHVERFGWMYGDSVGRYLQYDPRQMKPMAVGSMAAATVYHYHISTGDDDSSTDGVAEKYLGGLIPDNIATLAAATSVIPDVDGSDSNPTYTVTGLTARSGGYASARVQACNTSSNSSTLASTGLVLCMPVPLSLLQLHEFLPLPFIQGGIQIEFVLERPELALSVNDNVTLAATSVLDYSIVTPRMVCQFVQPSEEIMSEYLSLYKNNMLVYPYMKVQHYLHTNSGANGTFSFVMHPNARSAILATSVATNLNSNTSSNTANAYDNAVVYDSIGTFLKQEINGYQYKVGSDNYPDKAVSMPDAYNAEAFAQSQKAFGHLGSVLFAPRSAPWDWWSIHADSGKATNDETRKLIMAYDLARDGSIFSGVDVSIAPFQAEFTTSAAYQLNSANALRYMHTWIVSNAILRIGSSGVSVIN